MQDQLNNFPELKNIYESLNEKYGNCIIGSVFEKGELSLKVRKEYILDILKFLKHGLGFNALNDMIALDNPAKAGEGSKRFSILYQLYRFRDFQRVRIVIDIDDGEKAESIYSVYKSSNWAEREIFDMFGITFSGHPDLKRIYMWDGFNGFPLRKDFPLEG